MVRMYEWERKMKNSAADPFHFHFFCRRRSIFTLFVQNKHFNKRKLTELGLRHDHVLSPGVHIYVFVTVIFLLRKQIWRKVVVLRFDFPLFTSFGHFIWQRNVRQVLHTSSNNSRAHKTWDQSSIDFPFITECCRQPPDLARFNHSPVRCFDFEVNCSANFYYFTNYISFFQSHRLALSSSVFSLFKDTDTKEMFICYHIIYFFSSLFFRSDRKNQRIF